jgi:glycosyltransferase involved in cell wall biosynthesis
VRIAVVSSASAGGAGIAARRTANALVAMDDCEIAFVDVDSIGAVPAAISPQRNVSNGSISNTQFTADFGQSGRRWFIDFLSDFDAINLHWTSYLLAFSELEQVARGGTPILLTLHDFNYLTGGCHYPAGCDGFERLCEGCPQVQATEFPGADVIRLKLRKNALYRLPNIHICAPSRYLLDASACGVHIDADRLHLLRNPYQAYEDIGTDREHSAPARLLLVADSFLESRKAASLAVSSIIEFRRRYPDLDFEVEIAGKIDPEFVGAMRMNSCKVHSHGRIADQRVLAKLYARCDVQVAASHEDNWPNVLVEAAAYGCLCAVGPAHGTEEFCRELNAGVVSQTYTPEAFASALGSLLLRPRAELRAQQQALQTAARGIHEPRAVAEAYRAVLAGIVRGTPVDAAELPAEGAPPSAAMTAPGLAAQSAQAGRGQPAVVSSNYLGVRSRLAVAAQTRHGGQGRSLVIRQERPATSKSVVRIQPVYVPPLTLPNVALDGPWPVAFPLTHNGSRLSHVHAQESASYGLSRLEVYIE